MNKMPENHEQWVYNPEIDNQSMRAGMGMKNRGLFYILFFLSLMIQSVFAAEKWPEFNLIKAGDSQLPPARTVAVGHDPVYKTSKEYQAYSLREILEKLPMPPSTAEDRLIVFTAVDGYKVAMAYQDALSEEGFIAFKDNAAPANKKWLEFKFGKQTMTPAPYYLVWSRKGLDEWRYPWPFQLASVSLQSAKSYFGAAAPSVTDKKINNGFNQFSRYCIRCHSVNLSGGEVGPELNIPKNITEYFKEEELVGFILNAKNYRAGTKMPVFEELIGKDGAEDIVRYLKQMKLEKKN
ncbi:c-type cytochrome [Methylosarcina fibrata]|uniref:c-type cytochrome n=1 Tax=Methylosarcina fibrata TaxID=105972 RepID=UPI000374CC8C|nr:cytochrome c [Methylosarcina fibrata]